MVDRNQKNINERRKKTGKEPVTVDGGAQYVGRSWVFPSFLIALGIIFLISYGDTAKGFTYWFTAIAYPLLGLYFFMARRPLLYIGKSELVSRRFRGIRRVDSKQIQRIVIQPDYVLIDIKGTRFRWMFSRWFHMLKIEKMSQSLHEFATRNQIPITIKNSNK